MVRSVKKTIKDKIDMAMSKFSPDKYDYTFISFGTEQSVLENVFKYANVKIGENKAIDGIIPINVCAHCGPGTIGLVVSEKINGKSLRDFL
jgi:fatty acid-binding protein DegV